MSTFAELCSRAQGVGVAYLLEGSTNLFVATQYAYSTHDGLFGASSAYDQRIVEVGDLQRGFGVDGTLAASSVSVRLANTDAGVDFLITDPSVLFKVRWRLKIVLYDEALPSDFAAKALGDFVNLDNPARNGSSVALNLADDSFGQAAELAIPPTWAEALAVALDSESTQPPVPIAMGGGTIPCVPTPYGSADTSINFVLCATTDTAAVETEEVEGLLISGPGLNLASINGHPIGVRSTETLGDANNVFTDFPIWEIAKTASLTKDGRTWRVLYVTIFTENLKDWLSAKGFLARTTITNGPYTVNVNVGVSYFNSELLPQLTIEAIGPRFSSITRTETGSVTTIRAPDIAYDLLRYYSRGLTSGQVSQASFAAATAAFPMFFFKASYYFSNFIQQVTRVSAGSALGRRVQPSIASTAQGILRRAISELCQGGLFDVVTDWSGQFVAHVLANNFSLQTTTPTVVDETLIKDPTDKVPSAGERWAPYNRVIFASNGRILDNATAIAEWGVVLPRTINDAATALAGDTSFSGVDFGIGTFGAIGTLESKVRPIQSFDYPLDALAWELGEFIAVTWSRGDSGLAVYSSTVFRIEGLTLHPARCMVSVKAVWIDDLANQLPYLLDDETLLLVSKGATSGNAVPDGSGSVSFGGTIDLNAQGVRAGDILILRDSSQAATVFTRNGAWRIAIIGGAGNVCDIDNGGDGNQPAAGTVANADWYIVRGATSYPTAVSDPTNYPSGGTMYGKQADGPEFSDSSTANVLQAG